MKIKDNDISYRQYSQDGVKYMNEYKATVFDLQKNSLGEGPFYDERFKRYSWVDISKGRLWTLKDGKKECLEIGQPLGAAVPMPDSDGFEALKQIRRHCPHCAILIYTMHEEPWVLARLARLNIQGAVSKALPVSTLQQAVETIRQGNTFFDESFIGIIEQATEGQPASLPYMASPAFKLSEREQQVLSCIAEGLTTPEIAARLYLSENTVGTYRRRLMTKFDAHTAAQLVRKAFRHGEDK